jgi:hypothetical protein
MAASKKCRTADSSKSLFTIFVLVLETDVHHGSVGASAFRGVAADYR